MGSPSDATTTTWYAYQDPKSQREYFHNPESGETTWVLPTTKTSSSNSNTNNSKRMGNVHQPTTIKRERVSTKRDGMSGSRRTDTSQPSNGWNAIWITIGTILVFNTLFLLVLVKVQYDNAKQIVDQAIKLSSDEGVQTDKLHLPVDVDDALDSIEANTESDVDDSTALSSITEDSNETQEDDGSNLDEVEANEQANADETEVFSDDRDNNEATKGEDDEDAYQEEATITDNVVPTTLEGVQREDEHAKSTQTKKDYQLVESSSRSPINCWVPFSYIVIPKCRRRAREGLLMPLADADQSIWI